MIWPDFIRIVPKILQRREGHLQSKAVRTLGDQNERMAKQEKAPTVGAAACGKWAEQRVFILVSLASPWAP